VFDPWLAGNGGDDILIGGTTSHDASTAALNALMSEWTRALAYQDRINHLTNAVSGGNTGSFFLKAAAGTPAGATVFNDGVADALTGGTELDWFFSSGGDTSDQVVGSETRTDIA
jgi:hypothetical protein